MGVHQRGLSHMKKKVAGAKPSLSSPPPPNSFLLLCSGLYKTSQYGNTSKQINEFESVCIQRSTEIEEYTHTHAGGRIIIEKKRAVTFFIKTLADDQRRASYCWKTPPFPWAHRQMQLNPQTNTHTLKRTHSSTFFPPPTQDSFQTESSVPLSHLLYKVTIKPAENYERLCVCVFESLVAAL